MGTNHTIFRTWAVWCVNQAENGSRRAAGETAVSRVSQSLGVAGYSNFLLSLPHQAPTTEDRARAIEIEYVYVCICIL
jgi:hypothetical protein